MLEQRNLVDVLRTACRLLELQTMRMLEERVIFRQKEEARAQICGEDQSFALIVCDVREQFSGRRNV